MENEELVVGLSTPEIEWITGVSVDVDVDVEVVEEAELP